MNRFFTKSLHIFQIQSPKFRNKHHFFGGGTIYFGYFEIFLSFIKARFLVGRAKSLEFILCTFLHIINNFRMSKMPISLSKFEFLVFKPKMNLRHTIFSKNLASSQEQNKKYTKSYCKMYTGFFRGS